MPFLLSFETIAFAIPVNRIPILLCGESLTMVSLVHCRAFAGLTEDLDSRHAQGDTHRSHTLSLVNLDRHRAIITRMRKQFIRTIFPFLDLPGELRAIIYEFCIDVSATQTIIDRYYRKATAELNEHPHKKITDVEAPLIYTRCSAIFLINRFIFTEATFYLRKRSLIFDHGLLDLKDITDFISPALFRNVRAITITDAGHDLFQSNMLSPSWLGYVVLIEQVADLLAAGDHHLHHLTISFESPGMLPHVSLCWNARFACGFRDTLRRACDALLRVHNIGRVTLIGFPPTIAEYLKPRMEGPALNFLDLPTELRLQIYSHCADWSDVSRQLARTMARWTDKSQCPPYPPRTTPTILRLNRQISAQALDVLRKKPLIIACPARHDMRNQQLVPNMLRFITPLTLCHVRHLIIHVDGWEWIYSLEDLLSVFAFGHDSGGGGAGAKAPHLETFHLRFRDALKSRFLAHPLQRYPDHTLHRCIGKLAAVRGMQLVKFEGDLPACYMEPLVQLMCMNGEVGGKVPTLMAMQGDGMVVPVDGDDD